LNGSENIIFFDGVCNLCNGTINFIIDLDKKKHFKFAALQDEKSKRFLQPYGIGEDLYSFIYYEDGKVYDQSTAVLRIAKKLGGFWSLAYALIIFPRFIRNFVYQLIARNRYKWFGKKEYCRVPEPGIQDRFL